MAKQSTVRIDRTAEISYSAATLVVLDKDARTPQAPAPAGCRVALLSFDFGEYTIRLASALAEYCRVLLLIPESIANPFLKELDNRVTLQTFACVRLRQVARQLKLNRWLMEQVRGFGADVLHEQQGSMWFNMGLMLQRKLPVVLTVHDAEPHPGDKLSRKTPYFFWKIGFRRADRIIAQSNYVRGLLSSKLGIPLARLELVPHIQLGGCKKPVRGSDDGKTVLFFGRIWAYKGLEFLIKAEPHVSEKLRDVKFVIAGTGEDIVRYRSSMAHPDRFVIHNQHIAEADVERLFQDASVVVLPYIEASQSGVVSLAYTYGKPVIATRVGGLPEMVQEGITGLLVPPEDEHALATAILKLLTSKAMREAMGEAGRELVERECAPDVVARKTAAVYRGLLATQGYSGVKVAGNPMLE